MEPMPEGSIDVDDSQPLNLAASKPLNNPSLPQSDLDKVKHICEELTRVGMTLKEFIMGLLTKSDSDLKYRYRTWSTYYGWTSTVELVEAIGRKFDRSQKSADRWAQFILAEAINISRRQSPPRGAYPFGAWQSACTVLPEFFSEAAKQERTTRLTTMDTPFLYKFLLGTMDSDFQAEDLSPTSDELDTSFAPDGTAPSSTVDEAETRLLATLPGQLPPQSESGRLPGATPVSREPVPGSLDASMADYEGFAYTSGIDLTEGKQARYRQISAVVCSMVTFARNRRHNGMQLTNAIQFDACGISETVNQHLHYIGLTSSRKTAVQALRSLSRANQAAVVEESAVTKPFAPLLCIDNLDMEERIQMSSVGNQTRMFHGTWGYLHIPSEALWCTLNPDELSLEAYHAALKNIAQVMLKYVATPSDRKKTIPLDPLSVEPISHEAPNIRMLKLMEESDNSAEGIGQVMESLQRQSGLEPEEFFGRLQLIEGDLGTSQIFNAQFEPFACPVNITRWTTLACGGYLDALGIQPEKVIQKKDFTKMIVHMEQVHEATLWQCLRTVMNIENNVVEEQLPVIPTEQWNDIIHKCYNRFCSPDALINAHSDPRLNNLLVRMQDFSTVIEANRAMKAGDVGRLINIWKMWTFMTQSLPGLTHYSAYLPRLVLLITQILPPSLGKLIRHTLLVSPSGRPGHFVAKDFFLENYNYWLKHFYTRGGMGTQIERLKTLYSSNIPLLRSMFHSLRQDSGAKHVPQSHKSLLKMRALERFAQMAQTNDILHVQKKKKRAGTEVKAIPNTYLEGIKQLQDEISRKPQELGRFTMHMPFYDDQDRLPLIDEEDEMGVFSSDDAQSTLNFTNDNLSSNSSEHDDHHDIQMDD
ncbi:hypothetical protein PSHT_08425 [Puccinia striiformis]|uniref:DUF6589 domain-containing protein n=1 Tax=Puccinia striiformis TaxID=27350 RepID=A0A2S4VPU0_9BASI|nr:hypothetical protein PSHT_08425 [Puccinia striiformis]